jgi:hypothetical protein
MDDDEYVDSADSPDSGEDSHDVNMDDNEDEASEGGDFTVQVPGWMSSSLVREYLRSIVSFSFVWSEFLLKNNTPLQIGQMVFFKHLWSFASQNVLLADFAG